MKLDDIQELTRLWKAADLEEWQQDKLRPNVVIHKGAMTDANAICTCHGEKGEETAQFIVATRNTLPVFAKGYEEIMTLKYDVESHFIAEVDKESPEIKGFRMVRRGQRTRFKCKKCGTVVHEQFTPVGKLPPLLDNTAIPDYPCSNCEG